MGKATTPTTPSATPVTPEAGVSLETLRRTLPGRIAAFARTRPHKVALREKDHGIWQEVTWQQYYEETCYVGHMLWELGVRPGDHIAILSDNCPEWLYADLGAQGIGARSVGIYQTNPPEDVAYILSHSQSKLLFCEDQEQVDKAIEVAQKTPTVEHIVVFDPRGTRGYDDPRLRNWADFRAEGQRLATQAPSWYEEQLAARDPKEASMVVYTSGTTGPPKGAMICSQNVIPVTEATVDSLGASEDDYLLSYLPLCHVAEKIFSVFLPLTAGSIVHFGESIYTVQSDLREVSPTVFLGVPRIWEKIHASVNVKMKDASWLKRSLYHLCLRWGRQISASRLAQKNLSLVQKLQWFLADTLVFRALQERLGLRRCRIPVSGAAPISAELLQWFHAIGVPILEGYGQTECSSASHLNLPHKVRIGSVGLTIPTVDCKIAEDGEILLRGDCVFLGYLHQTEATQNTIDEDGWLHTGDIGRIDEDGFLHITGRKKEIIITSGGKNLSPEKIENALKVSPYIKEAIAIGDQRKFVSALVQIEFDTVGDWATRQKIPYTSFEDLSSKPQVVELIDAEIRNANESLVRVEQVRAFRLLPKELNQDDGELTATQKVRRSAVYKRFQDLIETMYTKKRS